MRVQLDADLFVAAVASGFHRELLAIFMWGYDGRHAVEIAPRDAPASEQWLAALDPNTQDLCRFALEVGLDAEREEAVARFTVHVSATHIAGGEWCGGDTLLLPPAAAVDLLGRPLKVLLENRQHDGAFLRTLAKVNPRYAAKLGHLLDKRWAELDSMGGITTNYSWVDEQTRDPKTKTRLWVLFDSDALAPGKPSVDAKKLAGLCKGRRVGHQMLARRACESYLPIPLLNAWRALGNAEVQGRRRARVQALAMLGKEQRYHYNMWKGFDGDANRDDLENVGDLYEGVLPHVRDTLRHGIHYAIADLFHEAAIGVQPRWLIDDEQEAEATALLNDLFSLV
jgi:hypothetical protein